MKVKLEISSVSVQDGYQVLSGWQIIKYLINFLDPFFLQLGFYKFLDFFDDYSFGFSLKSYAYHKWEKIQAIIVEKLIYFKNIKIF